MSEKKRRWFQIHLSTAIVMMFVAGTMMWINFRLAGSYVRTEGNINWLESTSGWPVAIVRRSDDWHHWRIPVTLENIWAISINALAAALICLAADRICEWRIRRREARDR